MHFIQTRRFAPQIADSEKVLKMLLAKYPDYKGPGDITRPLASRMRTTR